MRYYNYSNQEVKFHFIYIKNLTNIGFNDGGDTN